MAKHALFIGLLMSAMVLGGCATKPPERQENVSNQLTGMKGEMVQARTQIDKTLSSLNNLMTAPPDGLRSAYDRYAADVDSLTKNADDLADNADDMRAQRERWLAEWDKSQAQLQNPELKAISDERRRQVASRFKNIDESFDAARDSYAPLIENLDEVKTVLGNDLTPQGVSAVSRTDIVRNAMVYGTDADRNLESAISEFNQLENILKPATGKK